MIQFSLINVQTRKFIKFCVVGIICTVIDASVYYALYRLTGYHIAMVGGFVLSLGINYLLNTFWTFHQDLSVKTAVGVIIAHCFNIFVVRMGLMWIFISTCFLTEGVAYVPTLIISVVTNYLIVRSIYSYCGRKQ